MTEWYPKLAPGSYTVELTYVNFVRDIDNDSGTCLAAPCFTPIWTGTAAAGTATIIALLTPIQAIDALIVKVKSFNFDKSPQNSLIAKLDAAKKAIQKGNLSTACSNLTAFINHVIAQSGKKITVAQANELIAAAQGIKQLLGCP